MIVRAGAPILIFMRILCEYLQLHADFELANEVAVTHLGVHTRGLWPACVRMCGLAEAAALASGPQQRWFNADTFSPQLVELSLRGGGPFLCGDQLGVADLYVSTLLCIHQYGQPDPFPHTLDWIARIKRTFPAWYEYVLLGALEAHTKTQMDWQGYEAQHLPELSSASLKAA